MSNSRAIRRRVALGLAGTLAAQVVAGLPGPIAHAEGKRDETDPIIWTGVVPGATPDSMVVVHVQRLGGPVRKPGETREVQILGSAHVDEFGVATIHAGPGEWLDELADKSGRVELLVTASAEQGHRFGVGLTTVTWSPEANAWVGEQNSAESGTAGYTKADSGFPSSPITMTDASPEMLQTVEAAAKRNTGARSGARSVPDAPSQYACYGGASEVTGTATQWMSLGKYAHSGVGPSEEFTYETTETTSSEWGYKATTAVGPFTAAGRISVASQASSVAFASSTKSPDGTDKKWSDDIDMTYERRVYHDCLYVDEVPACGGR